jgi:hypothetical protein
MDGFTFLNEHPMKILILSIALVLIFLLASRSGQLLQDGAEVQLINNNQL